MLLDLADDKLKIGWGNGLVMAMQQAVPWAKVDPVVLSRYVVTLGRLWVNWI